jgi:hypothetical protein
MKSRRDPDFQKAFLRLPESVRAQARAAYSLFAQEPYHRSLHFKRVHQHEPLYSVRIGEHYRALGLWEGDTIFWFWIGSHAQYDAILAQF